jgi:hypothetical protein
MPSLRHPGARALSLPFTLFLVLLAGRTSPATPVQAGFFRFDPLVIRKTDTGSVRFELAVDGEPTRVVFELTGTGVDYEMKDDGAGADRTARDGIYSIAFPAQTLVAALTPDDVFRRFAGYVKLYQGTTQVLKGNIFASVLTDEIPPVEVTHLDADVQSTAYVVNILDPVFTQSHDEYRATRRFYDFFGDDYDMVNIVTFPSRFLNRGGGPVKNDVEGIGAAPYDNTPRSGSAGRLIHKSSFPIPEYFDGAENGFVHEIGHQWINALPLPVLAQGQPHWPVSTMSTGVMGYGNGQGLDFPCVLTEERGGIRLQPRAVQPEFSDVDLYVMGFIPPEQVRPQLVFADQAAAARLSCNGQLYTGPMTRVTVEEIIESAGVRRPPAGVAPTHFRVATILVTENELLSADAMAYYSYFAKRMELTEPVPIHPGLAKAIGKPFHVATRGIGTLDAGITRRAATADFTLTADPVRLTSPRGQDAVFTLSVTSKDGIFSEPVTFGCTNWTPFAPGACRFDPPTVLPGERGAVTHLTVSPSSPTTYSGLLYARSANAQHTVSVQLVVP